MLVLINFFTGDAVTAVILGDYLVEFFLHWPGLVITVFVCVLGFILDDDGFTSVLCFIYLFFHLFLFCIYHFVGGVF